MHLLKKINLALVLTLVLPPFLPLLLARESLDDPHYEEQAKQKMAEGVRKNLAAYDAVEGSLEAGPVTVRTRLGETVSDAGDGVVYDGIRFTAPKDLKGKDFVIYINVPSSWYNRYLMPVSGDFDEGFRNWMNADCLYQDLDRAEEKDRQRNFHMLGGSFFKPGMEYVLWFRRAKNGDRQEGELRAVIAFVPQSADEIRFDTDSMESALKLKRASAADQVKFLNSRGGRAMLDKDLFDPLDAKDRIDDVIAGIRASFRGRVGLFVTEEKIFPLCKKSPKMSEVRARYGAPDCIISDAEWKRVLDYAGREPEEDVENMVQHFYDYFAFNTAADDPEAHVKRVRTHSSDFAISNEFKKGDFMWQVPLKNLTLFYHNRKEVGRMYFFMDQTEFRIEKERKPLVIQEPPVGKYKIDEASVLNYEGGGKWQWLTHKGDKVVREFPLENHMLHGMGEGFHDNGKPSFLVPYLNGRANGEATLMNEEGKVTMRLTFQDGEQVKAIEEADPDGFEEKAKRKMAEGVRKNLAAYDTVEGLLEAGPVTVRTRLGETVSDAGEGEVYDGIRFTAPKDLKGKDFVCYSNGPATWYDRGIIPVSGDFDDESSIWENSDCLYQELDRAEEKDRHQNFYTLGGSFFRPGKEYVLWFRHGQGDAKPDSELRAVIAFVKRPKNQSVLEMDSMESALKLKKASAADQVKFLNSRGGRAMLDKDLFDPMDARESIDAVMAAIRTSTHSNSLLSGEIGVTCSSFKKLPKMADVISRHGAPDCVITPGERKRVRDHNRNARNDENDQNLVQHIYDYIVFETEEDDLDARVKRVRTHASFGQLKVPEKGSYRRSVNVSNLTLFYQDRMEVGRMYFFSGASEPLVLQEPPNGEYEDDKTSVYKYEGGGKWEWLSLKEGKVEMQIPYANHMMHGVGETFNENGKVIFRMPYVKGKLHGELIEMDEKGEVVSRRTFRNGQQMETEEGTKSSGKAK